MLRGPASADGRELDALLRKIARRLIRLLRPPADAPEPDALDFLESAQHAALSDWQPARNDAPPKRKHHSAFVEGCRPRGRRRRQHEGPPSSS